MRLVCAVAEQHPVLPPVFPVLHLQHRRRAGRGGQGRGVHLRRGGFVREDKLLVPGERAGADHARAGQPAQDGVPARAPGAVQRDAPERIRGCGPREGLLRHRGRKGYLHR